ncbi:hypothetical protein RHSIM_RhsimUnG0218300 [Rhododendron simsii]|uniref:Protein kinase domain-containing protein n=1 Tax=Rhododendron simsii TaxID=118357 RepID=A0A834L3H0_RHOSS|nr:hypothetical protein RHSIM_RhsimUnG0218300 [Rhododendron simsii]
MAFSFSPLLIPLLLLLLRLLHLTTASSPLPHSLSPNFTASYLLLDNNSNYGAFLATGPFSAALTYTSYLAVVHTASDTIVWSVSRSSLVPSIDATIRLTASGIYIGGEFGWSTPPFSSPVSLLQLQESGNLLVSAISNRNLSMGDYRFTVTTDDGGGNTAMTWNGLTYWKLSMDTRAYEVSNLPASYMVLNETGLFLLGGNSSVVVIQLTLNVSEFRIAQLEYDGRFSIKTFNSSNWVEEFSAPDDSCGIPNICGTIGVCFGLPVQYCSCPPGFYFNDRTSCSPVDDSYSLPSACNASGNGDSNVSTSYLELGDGMDYFLNDFSEPRVRGVNLSGCEHLCSLNCSCLGLFHDSSSGSCYLFENLLGSIIANSTTDRMGYIKALHVSTSAGLVRLPISGYRFGYKELVAAMENFRTKIGSGGFGTVYKGTLLDESVVAVKKITSLGVEGKREFCIEIAIIGNIRHVNLGSLDRVLFGNGYVLEWEERFKIALGTTQDLAYLHSSCEQKIIHCDVKPENILLDDNLQVKILDFGISKLLTVSNLSDVYSYRMVLLDIVRGRKNWSLQIHDGNTENDQSSLVHSIFFPLYALEMHKQRGYLELVDPRLEGRVTSEEEVEKLIRVALCCVHQDPALRPSMANVVGMLEGRYPVGVPRVESLRFLPFFGRRRMEVPRIEAQNVQNGLVLFSYMSSRQLSGARVRNDPINYKRRRGQRRYLELVDLRLEGRVKSEEEVEKLVRMALFMLCAHQALRPSMANVVGMLEGRYPVSVPQVESLSFLLFFWQEKDGGTKN